MLKVSSCTSTGLSLCRGRGQNAPGKFQFVIDKGNPWSFIEDLCLFKRICETHPWILKKAFSLSLELFSVFAKVVPSITHSAFLYVTFFEFCCCFCFLKSRLGTSLSIQWLRLCAPTGAGMGSVPWWGTKVPHAMWHHQKKKKRVVFENYFKIKTVLDKWYAVLLAAISDVWHLSPSGEAENFKNSPIPCFIFVELVFPQFLSLQLHLITSGKRKAGSTFVAKILALCASVPKRNTGTELWERRKGWLYHFARQGNTVG